MVEKEKVEKTKGIAVKFVHCAAGTKFWSFLGLFLLGKMFQDKINTLHNTKVDLPALIDQQDD